MTMLYNKTAKKKATNLTVNSDLLKKAKNHNINLSNFFEQALVRQLEDIEKKQWEKENQKAIENYNTRIEQDGVFSDGLRSF